MAEPESMEIHEAGLSLDLPDLVFETRAGANMTQAQLATALGTSKETVAAWESGAETPRVDELAKLARTCGKRLRLSIDVD